MNILKDKTYKEYNYLSRYISFPYYYNIKDQKYIYGLSKQFDTDTSYVAHKVKQKDTLDSLSNYYYNRPDLYWVIAKYNNINDCFINLYENFKIIKIPSLSSIKYKK